MLKKLGIVKSKTKGFQEKNTELPLFWIGMKLPKRRLEHTIQNHILKPKAMK